MAQLKDTNVAGNLRVTNTILTNEIKIFDTIKFANTSAVKHILFTRITSQGGPSYICYPSNGQLAIGTEIGYDNAIAVFDGTSALRPGKTNTFNLGTNDQKWKNVYATTFVGALTGNADTATKFSSTRKIELTGAITGSATTDGENGWTINTSVNHNHNDLYVNVDGDTITGPIRRFYTANSEEPMFQLVSNDKTVYLWKIAHGNTSTENTSSNAGFGLQYYGEGTGRANYLRLKADNQNGNTKYTALCIDQQGKVGLGDDAQENFQLYSKGAALIARNSSSTTTLLSSQLVIADMVSGNNSTGQAPAIELYRHQKTCWQIINGTDGKLSVRSNYTNAVQSTYLPVLYKTSADGRIIEWHDYILTKGTNPSSDTTNTQVIGYFGSGIEDADRAWEHRSLITSAGVHQYYLRAYGFKSGSTSNVFLRFSIDTNNSGNLYTNSTFFTEGSSIAYSTTAFVSSHTKSPNGCIRFDTRAGTSSLGSTSKTTYTNINASGWAYLYISVPTIKHTYATAGDINSAVTNSYTSTPTRFFFRQYSYTYDETNETIAKDGNYEDYLLPATSANLTANTSYTIVTTKMWPYNRTDIGDYIYIQQNGTKCGSLSLSTVGLANTEGWVSLTLGNSTQKSTEKNASGRIVLYSSGSKAHIIQPSNTGLTSGDITHYLPNTAGWIVTAGDGTSTGAGSNSQPVYISENGIATAISTINIAYGGTGISTTDPHKVLIGAVSGSTASAPTWRTIDNADLPGQGKITIAGTAVSLGGSISLATMGLSNALHFIGITSTELSDGATTATLTAKTASPSSLSKTTGFVDGDVVMDGDQLREYVWSGSAWRLLGITTSAAYTQPASTATNTWIAQISQGTDGKITATTGTLNTSGVWSGKAAKANTSTTTNALAYYTDTDGTFGNASKITVYNNIDITVQNAAKKRNGIYLSGTCYGNDATDLTSNTKGVMRYEDGGVRIEFGAGNSDNAALLYTNHDSANTGGGASFHFVGQNGSNDTGGNLAVTAPDLVARRRMIVGKNFIDSAYTLYSNGATYINGALTTTGTSWLKGPLRIGNSDTAGTGEGQNGYASNNSGSTNYIAFYGTYNDGASSFNHTYIGESIYGPKDTANEKSELLLFKGNDISTSNGPDRIRLFAREVDIQVYETALSGTWDTIRATTGTQVANFAKGQVTINGNLAFNHTNNTTDGYITWNSGTYLQRISITDDSTANTAVFKFQQSSNSGTSYTDLFTINDNGTVSATTFNGSLSGNATSASAVPWSGITSNPISFTQDAYGDEGWKKLGGRTGNTSVIKIWKPTDAPGWGAGTHSAAIVYGTADTKGMLDINYSSPIVSIAGGSVSGSTDAAPKWYFKLSATTGQTYTFPSATCTLASSTDAVKVNYSTTSAKAYLMGSANAPTSTKTLREAVGNSNIYINATNGLSAVQHTFNDGSGNDKAYVQYNSTDDSLDFVFA